MYSTIQMFICNETPKFCIDFDVEHATNVYLEYHPYIVAFMTGYIVHFMASYFSHRSTTLINNLPELVLVNYSKKSLAVFGDINKYHKTLTKMGGIYNANLVYKNMKLPGIIFPIQNFTTIHNYINDQAY